MHDISIVFLLVGTGLLALLAVYALIRSRAQKARKRIYDSELAIQRVLNGLGRSNVEVFHSLQAGKFNIDHVVVSRTGVFVLESRFLMEHVASLSGDQPQGSVIYDDGVLHFPKGKDAKAAGRAWEHASWIGGWLSRTAKVPVRAKPVIVLAGWAVACRGRSVVQAIALDELRPLLTGTKVQLFSDKELQRIVQQLRELPSAVSR